MLYIEDETTLCDQFIIPNFANVVAAILLSDNGEIEYDPIDEQQCKLTVLRRASQRIPYADVIKLTVVTNE